MNKNRKYLIVVILFICAIIIGCSKQVENSSKDDNSDAVILEDDLKNYVDDKEEKPKPVQVYLEGEQETVYIAEAEDGVFTGNVIAEASKSGFSGTGYISGLNNEGDTCTVDIEVEEDGVYDLNFVSASSGGYKENYVYVDDEKLGIISAEEDNFTDAILEHVYLTAGAHKITVESYWGWVLVDKIEVRTAKQLNPELYKVEPILVNEKATDNTKRLMSYLCDIYDEYFISGQYCNTGQFGKEFVVINKETGKTPALLGLDYIEYSTSRAENGSSGNQTDLAINFWESGGIVTFAWHWNAPAKYLTGEWYRGFYTEATNINLKKIMDGEDEEGYELLMKDIDVIANELLKLQEAGVPILWRPLHEASGGWFWWGASGAEAYKELYILLYDKLTNEYGLNNLIWVWNGQDGEWYPGDEYVDIVGEDIYPGEQVYTSQVARYIKASDYTTTNKLVYLTENGCIYDPDLALRDGAMWGIWCTWSGEFVAKDIGIHTLSEQYTDAKMLNKAYLHEKVLTLDELPDLTEYPIR